MDKMLMVAYNEAIDQEVMEALKGCGIENYTKVTGVFGCGNASGRHLNSDIWPGKNNLLYAACGSKQAQQVMECVRELRKAIGREGIKAFILPIEEAT